jgi:hypothetical protein
VEGCVLLAFAAFFAFFFFFLPALAAVFTSSSPG